MSTLINKLQRIHNIVARIITGHGRCEHITPVLKSPHWLPVQQRITFKTLVLVYKAVNNLAPVYLQELLHPQVSYRGIRSSEKNLCVFLITRVQQRIKFLITRVQQRIKFKTLVLVYKAVNNLAPVYLQELLHPQVSYRGIRSSEKNLCVFLITRVICYPTKCFQCCWTSHMEQSSTEPQIDVNTFSF